MKKIILGVVIIISILISLFIIDGLIKHEKYGNEMCKDSFGEFCACSQIISWDDVNNLMCDYAKPVYDILAAPFNT